MRKLIISKDYEGIRKALSENPLLANEGIPFDENNKTKAHPLHRICDGVFNNYLTDSEGVEIAKIFLEYGAEVNSGNVQQGKDTPLIAAASLNADQVGVLYIDRGADISHTGTSGATALHWAAWCGRDVLVERLISEHAEINKLCTEFESTPLLWAVHGYKFGGGRNIFHQIECVKMLLAAGADKSIPNKDGFLPIQLLDEDDKELVALLK